MTKDFYLDPENTYLRLLEYWHKYGSLIIAFDFDDTVYDTHKQGNTYDLVIELLKRLHAKGCKLICWTCNTDEEFVRNYLIEHNIPFDTINEQIKMVESNPRKIYANAYLDDKAGLYETYWVLNSVLSHI